MSEELHAQLHKSINVVIRLWANYRRKVSSGEVKQLMIQMAEELRRQGYKPGEIVRRLARGTPYSERWIRQILPRDYKMEQEATGAKRERNMPRNYFPGISVSDKGAGSVEGEGEAEGFEARGESDVESDLPRDIQERLDKITSMFAKTLIEHKDELLRQPTKAEKKKVVLAVIEDQIELGLLTARDVVSFLARRGLLRCPCLRGERTPPCCRKRG